MNSSTAIGGPSGPLPAPPGGRTAGLPAVLALLFCLAASCASAPPPAREPLSPPDSARLSSAFLSTLRPAHPRLLADGDRFAALKSRVAGDIVLRSWHRTLRQRGEAILLEQPASYEIPDGIRLLETSRKVRDRIYVLALLYRLEGDRRFADRAWRELHAASEFPDWNPRHFLDTAEMVHAFAIGYDWLHDAWTPGQRETIRAAIIGKGLVPARRAYEGGAGSGAWTEALHNWNPVCNGGIGMGALAVAEEDPRLSESLLREAIPRLARAMGGYGPDGAWVEGPGYWHYATFYSVVFIAGLSSALGTDFGLSDIPGFRETGEFPIYMTGPTGRAFGFADAAGGGIIRAPEMMWLAKRFGMPSYLAFAQAAASPHPLDLLWYDPPAAPQPAGRQRPLDKRFRVVDAASFRSAWNDPEAVFLAFKAGGNGSGHAHLDVGTFVVDALGERWAIDLGSDDYARPGYFGKERWDYYRLRAEGHNTLVIRAEGAGAGPDQHPGAAGNVARFVSRPDRAFAVCDLTPAYSDAARSVRRGLALIDRTRIRIQDEIAADRDVEVYWFLHTRADVEIGAGRRTAVLSIGARRLLARLLSPPGAAFTLMDARPLPSSPSPMGQGGNAGVRKLLVRMEGVRSLRLAVELIPLPDGRGDPPFGDGVLPLDRWE